MAKLQTDSAWGRAYGKDAHSHHCCSTCFLLPYCMRVAAERLSVKADVVTDMVCIKMRDEKGGRAAAIARASTT